jgi:16S rRNA (cytidine1402-2'-O)-methyltransferase
MQGKLYLIPNTLGSDKTDFTIPNNVASIAISLQHFIVEDIRTARRFLKLLDKKIDIDNLQFYLLNKHTPVNELINFLAPLKDGYDMGIVSEAGCPAIADPGAEIVRMAHETGIKVVPLTGPSSIFLALSASGMNGQNFAFNGYLPVKKEDRIRALKYFENRSRVENQSQIFIETPYRNMALLEDILNSCHLSTRLCIACNITLSDEYIVTQTIKQWKSNIPELNKKQTIFIIQGIYSVW